MIYYISDTHFRDQAIFDKCKRPFNSLDEMESTVISKWNNKVNDEDVVYVLGDIVKDDDVSAIQIFTKLKGHKHLIVGNHDHLILEEMDIPSDDANWKMNPPLRAKDDFPIWIFIDVICNFP